MKIDMTKPIFFDRNRVYRIYKGGLLFSDFFGDEQEDNNYPEEWVASTVKALNPGSTVPLEGYSLVEHTDITLKSLMEEHPWQMAGPAGTFPLLVKLLDSAMRLPLQIHPDRTFSQKYLNSNFGKTEMWIVLNTREDASIYFGFKENMTKESFITYIERSRNDRTVMDTVLNKIPVQPGEVYLIPSRCVHAIGAGCLILEVQEPTDFTIQPEYWCGEYLLPEDQLYLGLGRDIALDCFDYSVNGPDCMSISKKIPRLLSKENGIKKEMLMGYEDTPCFSVNRYTVHDSSFVLGTAPAVYIVTEGSGMITGNDYKRELNKGMYFYLPYGAKGQCAVQSDCDLQLIECLPPLADV